MGVGESVTTDYSIELLRDFVKVVGNDPDPNTLVSNIAIRTLAHLDCRGAILGIIRHEGFLDLIGTYGYSDELTDPYKKIPLWSPLPITDAARTGKPIVLTALDGGKAELARLGVEISGLFDN